jgi:asparagine synthetase B (glutamine-hydrolysing)
MRKIGSTINLGNFQFEGRGIRFICHLPDRYISHTERGGIETILIGRTFSGVFCEVDGNYISIKKIDKETFEIDRDMFGSIPLFYSPNKNMISTDIRELIPKQFTRLNCEGVSEYIACAFTSLGTTIYDDVFILRPDEMIRVTGGAIVVTRKVNYFSSPVPKGDIEQLLEAALERSIGNLVEVAGKQIILNLSGGNDSTLILALLRRADERLEILSNTFYHSDWREDIDDWCYAEIASKKFNTKQTLVKIENESFERAHKNLLSTGNNVFHTYATAFYMQNKVLASKAQKEAPIVNGSGPDETMIGTEKIAIKELLAMNKLSKKEWIKYALSAKDYIKIDDFEVWDMLKQKGSRFLDRREQLAEELTESTNFVEFQRRFHSMLILQDHICELSQVAAVVGRPIFFPFLTNDIFHIIFGASFTDLNQKGVYKAVIKKILLKYMEAPFVHRQKVGFQSPSRKYFMSSIGFGLEIESLLKRDRSKFLDMMKARQAVRLRLSEEFSITKRYDFVEWTIFNLLRLEALNE